MSRILVYLVGGIGDTLVALPAFRMLKANFPDDEFELLNLSVVPSACQKELYEHTDIFRKMTFFAPDPRPVLYAKFARFVLTRHYDALYCFSPDMPKSLATFFRIAHSNRIFHCAPRNEYPRMTLAEAYLRKLETLPLTRPADGLFVFPLTPDEIKKADAVRNTLRPDPMVAFGIGGNQNVCRWPLKHYAELIGKMKKKHAFTPVFIGGEKDRTDAEILIRSTNGVFLQDTSCKTLRETIAFLRLCRGYVGNDTGSIHLAATAGIPCIGIYSAHDPVGLWTPFAPGSIALRHDPECAGCRRRICQKGDPAPCLARITSEEVLDAAERLLFP